MPENVIFGTGPLGLAVARRLVSSGKGVRLVNRSGKAQGPPGAEVFAADASDPAAARRACQGAIVVFHCATHSYGQWDKVLPPIMSGIIGGGAASAGLVDVETLYAYGPVDGPIREDLPYKPVGPNTNARAEVATTLMNAHAVRKLRATIGRGSDFYGPHARQSKAGDLIFARAIAGKPAQVVGNPDLPHTLTFIDDFAAGLVTLSRQDRALGEAWHGPNAVAEFHRDGLAPAPPAAQASTRSDDLHQPDGARSAANACRQGDDVPVSATLGGGSQQVRARLRRAAHSA